MSERDDRLRAGLTAIWRESRAHVLEQVAVLEAALSAAKAGGLSAQQRHLAEREAHRLAGSVGNFGFREASDAARELEEALLGDAPLDADRFEQLVRTMRTTLDTDTLPSR